MIRASASRTAAAALTLVLLAGCGSGTSSSRDTAKTTDTAPAGRTTAASDKAGTWTVLAYVNGDNNLEEAALSDLEQMTKATATTFIVLVDRSPEGAPTDLFDLGDFDDTRMLRILDGEVTVLSEPGELNMGDPATLQTFVSSGLRRYAGEHNALVIWDHGGSWNGASWDDSSGGDNLTLPELGDALDTALGKADTDVLDLIGFDACLMSTYDVAAQLAPHANYLLASEEVEPGDGWDWSALSTKGGATTRDLAGRIIKGFTAESAGAGSDDTTLSLLDLTKVDELTAAIDHLAQAMAKSKATKAPGRIGAGRSSAISFGKDPNPENDYFLVDLGDLSRQLARVEGLGEPTKRLDAAIAKVVVTHGDGPVAASATGLAVYFPPTRDLRRREYAKVPTAKPWNNFLSAYYGAVQKVPDDALPNWIDNDRLVEDGDKGIRENDQQIQWTASVSRGTGGNIADARLFWGEVDIANPESVVYYGDRNAAVAGDQVRAAYDWNQLVISDGTRTTTGYASLTFAPDGDLVRIIIPIIFTRGAEQAEGNLQLGLRKGKVIAETFYIRTGEGIAAIPAEPGDRFIPLLKHQDLATMEETWLTATSEPLAADRDLLDFAYGRMPSSSAILLGLSITDLAGSDDFLFYGTASP